MVPLAFQHLDSLLINISFPMFIRREPKCWGVKCTNAHENNDQFEIDVFLWSIGTMNQFSLFQKAKFKRAFVLFIFYFL